MKRSHHAFLVALLGHAFVAPREAAGQLAPGTLNRFAAERLVVMPTQGVATIDSLGWRGQIGPTLEFLLRADSAFSAALVDRGLSQWVFPAALARSARRNPTYLTDPYKVRAAGPIRAALRTKEPTILEPLSSQLRALAAVSDSRWVLVPLEVGFVRDGERGGRVMVTAAIVDVRGAQVRWSGTVVGETVATYTFDAVVSAFKRFADLVVPSDG